MIKGDKVFLKSLEYSNIYTLMKWRNEPELRRYFREYKEISRYKQRKWYENRVYNNPNQIDFQIHDDKTNKLIGHCGLNYIDWTSRHGEFSIYIGDKEYRGEVDYGIEAFKLLLKYGFKDLNLNRIWGEVYENNTALNDYLKLGFKKEGVLRNHYYDEGRYWDSYIIAILKSEYIKKYGNEQKEKQKPI